VTDIETQAVVDAHVLVGDPDQGKEGHDVVLPVRLKQACSE
jgi:hypothetical protein